MIRMIKALWRRFYAWRYARRHPIHYAAAGHVSDGSDGFCPGTYVCGQDHPDNARCAGSTTWSGERPPVHQDNSRFKEILLGQG